MASMTTTIMTTPALIFFPALMAYSATSDLLTMRIPNLICAALALGYCGLALATGVPLGALGFNVLCGIFVLVLTFGLFQVGCIGGGDAKLAAATALWIGWGPLLNYGLYTSILGGVLTLAVLGLRFFPLPNVLTRLGWVARLADPKTGVPYGVALAAAGMMVYPDSQIWHAVAGG